MMISHTGVNIYKKYDVRIYIYILDDKYECIVSGSLDLNIIEKRAYTHTHIIRDVVKTQNLNGKTLK